MRRRRLLTLPLLLLVASSCKSRPLEVEIDRAELQARVAKNFPLTLQHLIGELTLTDPNVLLTEGSDRLGVDMNAELRVGLLPPAKAALTVSGRPRYDSASKAFFLDEPKLDRLEITGLAPEQSASLKAAVETVAVPALERIPVYELAERDLKESAAARVLSAVSVKNGKLVAELSLSR